jgi:hypothetical protein
MFVVAFCFGISVSAAWRIYTLPVLPDLDIEPVVQPTVEQVATAEVSDELRIVGGTHACGASPDGAVYELSDGGRIAINCKTFKSRAAATRALESRLINAAIKERSMNIDSDGNRLGDEVLISGPNAMMLKTDGRLFCVTQATSFNHLLWFAKPRRRIERIE